MPPLIELEPRARQLASALPAQLGLRLVKITRLPDVSAAIGAASRSGHSTACISVTAR